MIRREILLGLTLLAALAFLVSAALVRTELFIDLDRALIHAARTVSSPFLDRMMGGITTLGWAPIVVPLVVLVTAWSAIRRDAVAAVALAAVGLLDYGATELLKHGFGRARPDLYRHDLVTFAFPSGHAMTAVAVYGMVLAVVARRLGTVRARVVAWVLGIAIGFLVGGSRVYLAVHWPTDVLGGWAFGIILLCLGGMALVRWPAPR